MAGTIAQTPAQPLIIGRGAKLNASAIGDCTPMEKGKMPGVVYVSVDWADYGASSVVAVTIEVDLNTLGPNNPLDAVRSCYIDNTFSPTTVYILFPDTGFTIVCPPYSVVKAPAWTNGKKARLYAAGFDDLDIPTTTFIFTNIHTGDLAYIPALLTAPPKSILPVHHARLIAGVALQTYTACALGVAVPSRRVIFASLAIHNAAITSNSATINGQACSQLGTIVDSGISALGRITLWRPDVQPTGLLTATITVTYSVAPQINAIQVFSMYNVTGDAGPYDILTNVPSGGATIVPMNLTTPINGVAMYVWVNGANSAAALVMGIENGQKFVDNLVAPAMISMLGYQSTQGQIIPVRNFHNSTALGACGLCASFN